MKQLLSGFKLRPFLTSNHGAKTVSPRRAPIKGAYKKGPYCLVATAPLKLNILN